MENRSHAFVAGLFMILLGAALAAGAMWFGTPRVTARMPIDLVTTHSVAGLKVDAPVRYRGVDVGRVTSIAFDKKHLGEIRVRVAVDPAAPVNGATFARLTYQGLNGMALVQLDDDPRKPQGSLRWSPIPVMELQAGMLERAEEDVRDVLLKTGRVASRVEALLSDENAARLMAMVDSFEHTSQRVGVLVRDLEPGAEALPSLLRTANQTVERAQVTADNVSKLAANLNDKLKVLDTLGQTAQQLSLTAADLRSDTLPRVDTALDEVSVDAREVRRALHQAGAEPQSFIFGLRLPPPGPGEPGYVARRSEK